MIRLISTCEPARLPLVMQFVQHYRRQGVQDFILSLQIEPGTDRAEAKAALALAERISEALHIQKFRVLELAFDAMAIRTHHDKIQREFADDDWIVWADIDEFHWFNSDLIQFCEYCDEHEFNAVRGYFVDRISRDGQLVQFDPSRSIWAQFPVGCNATAKIVRGMTKKVVLARASVAVRHANHDPARHQKISWAGVKTPVFHFKWDATVLARLEARLTPSWQERCPWWTQSASVIGAISCNSGTLPIEQLDCFDFGDDEYPEEHFPYEKNSRYGEQWIHWQSSLPDPSQ